MIIQCSNAMAEKIDRKLTVIEEYDKSGLYPRSF